MVSMYIVQMHLSLESQTATIKEEKDKREEVKGDNIFACKIVAKLLRGRGCSILR